MRAQQYREPGEESQNTLFIGNYGVFEDGDDCADRTFSLHGNGSFQHSLSRKEEYEQEGAADV